MKKILAVLLAFVMAWAPVSVFAQSEPSAWAKDAIDVYADAFLKTECGELDYTGDITREQFTVLMTYMFLEEVSPTEPMDISVNNPFTDCNNPLVAVAYGLQLVKGVSDTEFQPNASITREQICVMISRMISAYRSEDYLELSGSDSANDTEYSDWDDVSSWATEGVRFSAASGLIQGTDEGRIEPKANCTVEQALIIAKRIRDLY